MSKSFDKKPDAEAHRAKIENSLRDDTYVSAETAALTVADAVTAWISSKKEPGDATMAKYNNAVNNYVIPRWGNTRLSAVKRTDVDQWVSALQNGSAPRRNGMKAHSGGLAPATIDGVLVPFIAGLRFAVSEGWIRRNPAEGVETPRVESDPVIFLTHAQLDHLVWTTRHMATPADALMIAAMGNIGLRIGEVAALTVGAVDLKRRRISVTATFTTDINGRPLVGRRAKTTAGTREVPIPPHLVDDLRALVRGRAASAPLFPSSTGTHLSVSNWRNRVWSKVTAEAGTPDGLTPKGLRHTAASLAIAAGADVLMVQRMLGHADATETLNTYAKLFPDRMDEVTERMSKAREKALRKRTASQGES
ncbi:tyrosine-type recombinase/integrase [Microbacterium sp. SL75]|uniref:tyrosine-type recombinase/integrase n=1 Tax=Microbacterium sp. SL75 TaxID=2995140 RepID=UPI00226F03B9|nr:tyrosine-type recombinase/integrase [Microbacterium sp. SL75]WAC68545.1 tyrosine-type recombinase/integrase [Microbacterium sp. SL75]